MFRDAEAHLAALSEAGGGSQPLRAVLAELLDATVAAVPSCLAISVTSRPDEVLLTITALVPGAAQRPVRASLQLRLPRPASGGPRSHLTVYAAEPGALNRTAVDLLGPSGSCCIVMGCCPGKVGASWSAEL